MARQIAVLAAGTIFLLDHGRATAQDAPPDPDSLEEIVVTADRPDSFAAELVQAGSFRGDRQLDTPLTVSIIPRTLLDAQQAANIGDALRNSAGVTGLLTSPSVYNNLSIRGIPVDPRGNFRLNGSLSIVNFIDLPLENKARIEVLKGASALYYGFAAPSGIVNLVTKRPPSDAIFDVTVSGNSHGQLQGAIDAGDTFGGIGFRGTLAAGSVDLGIERTKGHRSFQAGAVQVQLNETLQFNFDVENIFKQVTEPTIWQGPTARNRLLTELPDLPSAKTNAGSEGFLNRARETNLLGRLRWLPFKNWGLTVEAGLSKASRDRRQSVLNLFEPDTGNGSLQATVANDQQFSNRSLRADFAGNFRTGFLRHQLVVGASTNRRLQYFTPPTIVAGVSTRLGRDGCVALGLSTTCVQNGYDPIPLANLHFSADPPYDPSRDTIIKDRGLYVFDRIRFGGQDEDLVSILLGLRKSFYREAVATNDGTMRTTFQDEPWLMSGGAVIKPRPWVSVYASYIEGVEGVPPAPNFTANQGEILPPGEARQYEAGLKIEPLPGWLVTAARFNIRRQLIYVNANNFFVNDGIGRYRGWELGLSGEPVPRLSIFGSAMFLDATQVLEGDPNLDGNRPENTAKLQWSLFAEYRLERLVPGLAVNAGAFYTSKRAINPENSLFVPSYTLFDVGGSYTFRLGSSDFVARITAQNITGKRYFASTGSNNLAQGVPSAVKFSLEAKLAQ